MKKIKTILAVLLALIGFSMASKAEIKYPYHFTYDGNPLVRIHGAADPDAHVWDDTVWLYCSQDFEQGYASMDSYHVFSSKDMVHWTDHGEILHSRDVDWGRKDGGFMWAPCAARKKDESGKYKYYLYFPHKDREEKWKIGVAVSDKPAGPFTDIGNYIEGTSGIDPSVLVDDDGQAYMYFDHNKMARLKENMIEFAEEPQKLIYGSEEVMSNPNLSASEGPYIHKYKGKYYFSYTNLNGPEFKSYYTIADNPYGPFEFMGPISRGSRGAQDHHSIIEFKEQSYYFYHIALPPEFNIPPNKQGHGRVACFDKLFYNPDGTIRVVKHTFGPQKYLSVEAENGYYTFDPPGGAYEEGTLVKITAKPNLGYRFASWQGDVKGRENPVMIKMDNDRSVVARFAETPTFTLRTHAENGAVQLASTIGKYDGKIGPSVGEFNRGTKVMLEAVADFGYDFKEWAGNLSGSENPAVITMDRDETVAAQFVPVPVYTLAVNAPNGMVKIHPATDGFEAGTEVSIEAVRDYGYTFTKWSGDISGTDNPATIRMDADKKITAEFKDTGDPKIVFAVNCGGAAFRSEDGIQYAADKFSRGGGIFSRKVDIPGTTDDVLYGSERMGARFGYTIPLPNGTYEVTLKFAEIFFNAAGKRVFSVDIEGDQVVSNLDLWAEVKKNASYECTHTIELEDGQLDIDFRTVKENAKISAIKIVPGK